MILLLQLLDWFRFYYFDIGFLCWFGFGFWWALEDCVGLYRCYYIVIVINLLYLFYLLRWLTMECCCVSSLMFLLRCVIY